MRCASTVVPALTNIFGLVWYGGRWRGRRGGNKLFVEKAFWVAFVVGIRREEIC